MLLFLCKVSRFIKKWARMELAGISWQKTLMSLQIGAVKLYKWS